MQTTATSTSTSSVTAMDNLFNSYITRKARSFQKYCTSLYQKTECFAQFVFQEYDLTLDELIKILTTHSHGPKIDVYDLLSDYVSYIQDQRDVSPLDSKWCHVHETIWKLLTLKYPKEISI